MEQPYLKAFSRWLRVCVIAGACVCLSAGGFAQGDTAGTKSPSKKTPGAKTAGSKHAKTASSGSKAGDSKATASGATDSKATSTGAAKRSASRLASKHGSSRTNTGAHGAHNSKIADARGDSAEISKKQGSKKTITAQGQHSKGQQKIDPARAQAIQEALIREHYMDGEPAGFWNQESEEAMRRYQADHGWQSKEVPDSRALISLGLGPSHDHLLNPESAMTTGPDISHSASVNSSPASRPASTADPISAPSEHDPAGPQ